MTFTTTPPTVPGFYAWRRNIDDTPEALTIIAVGKDLHNPTYDASPAYMGGEWCRLVPAEEVARAFYEGMESYASEEKDLWNSSRAKQIAEGTQL